MTKADIINEVSKNTGFTKVEVENQLDSIINTIKLSLSKGERIDIRGFGSFVVKERPKRLAVNPSTKEFAELENLPPQGFLTFLLAEPACFFFFMLKIL